MTNNAMTEKILVLGIDGMDPELTEEHLREGIMPNLEAFLKRGSAREDLHLLGSHPTITPPMWTTLATGAHPYVHGITDFWRQDTDHSDTYGYGLDSSLCKAEQIWNVFAEAGKNTVVWHWPGSSWPPSSESPNLTVVDGTQPEGVNMGTGQIYSEFIAVGSVETEVTTFKVAAGETAHMCVITDLEEKNDGFDMHAFTHFMATAPDITMVGPRRPNSDPIPCQGGMSAQSLDISLAPIKDATGWAHAPKGAKESTILFSRGFVRRPVLLLQNEKGQYDKIAIYKNKKTDTPIAVLENDVFAQDIVDEAIKNDVKYEISRNMRIIDMPADGSSFRIWCSSETDINDDKVWSPKSLFQEIKANCGYPQPVANLGCVDHKLITDCMQENWMRYAKWQADCLNFIIEQKQADVVFSHLHNDDAQKHMFIQFAKDNCTLNPLPWTNYQEYLCNISRQNDYYLGRFLHLLDKDWTILLLSDHGLTCNMTNETSPFVGGIDVNLFVDWGFTALKKDPEDNYLDEIDWANTKAIRTRMNEIYLNLKGRQPTGIVDPANKWELEEEIITKLYETKSSITGKRMISLALRNKDAVHFGLGGPECGDIVYFTTDGYNTDHGCGLSTTLGAGHTSQSPIFAAAGKGIKENFKTTRVIRQIDVAATIATLGGVRMPADCEGAPAYQILTL